jgi:hypothetical protein
MPSLSYSKLYEETVDNIMNSKNMNNVSDALWKTYYNLGAKCTKTKAKGLKILLLNAPCNGIVLVIYYFNI